jgi:ATP-dependent helicase HepA
MLKEGMYVRCPADVEDMINPRMFVCGQIVMLDELSQKLRVKIYDPFDNLKFFESLPQGLVEYSFDEVEHCNFFVHSKVLYKGEAATVISHRKKKTEFYEYYLQIDKTKKTILVSEINIEASFNNGEVNPVEQLKNYEFQHPCWYFGHSIVSQSMNILENSMSGFKTLAGAKIYLLPHQIKTIMRCIQDDVCRYMLADEVGMGKTIEALSILKIFIKNHSKSKIMIIVPEALKEQWKIELFLKFDLAVGDNENDNKITLKTLDECSRLELTKKWDFVIIDEVHNYLTDNSKYMHLHDLSKNAENVLLLSATPVQQEKQEYLQLLRLLQPQKYDEFTEAEFIELMTKQEATIQRASILVDLLGEYQEAIDDAIDEEENPTEYEDCCDLFEEIQETLDEISDLVHDDVLDELCESAKLESDDYGVQQIKTILAYICSNYQIESHLIRNRRRLLEIAETDDIDDEDQENKRLMPKRELITLGYTLDKDLNAFEAMTYEDITEWIEKASKTESFIENELKPIIGAFFSSPFALTEELANHKNVNFENLKKWYEFEKDLSKNINNILDDPDSYPEYCNTRPFKILNFLYDDIYNEKVVLFTNYNRTFNYYKNILSDIFEDNEVAFFSKEMDQEDLEVNAYKFQNSSECKILLCDETGGEGRNFQCADYVIHIDLPWDANSIEQRIGRLDRLERDPDRNIVYSVVPYIHETFEEALFKFWNDGLNIFNSSLSGMEIMMNKINQNIIDAIQEDFTYGLFNRIPKIIQSTKEMREKVRSEQNYDVASSLYREMDIGLDKIIDYYTSNENELFTNAMIGWSSLSGFNGRRDGYEVKYLPSSFSLKSAQNSLLIPPKWNDYLMKAQNNFVNEVQSRYYKKKTNQIVERSIRGTFSRKVAIENDYLRFFSPGDEIFDCIINNALENCKGRATAFSVRSNINWKGFIYTWKLVPDINYLLDQGLSLNTLNLYRGFIDATQIITCVTLTNPNDLSDQEIEKEFRRILSAGFKHSDIVHFGKRGSEARYLKSIIKDRNIDWFKERYPEIKWHNFVKGAYMKGYNKAMKYYGKHSNIKGAKIEMERTLAAKIANNEYLGLRDYDVQELKDAQDIIMESLKHSKAYLDSAAFVWMVNLDEK